MIGAAALFSTGGAAIKGTDFTGIRGALELAAWRSGIAAVAVALLLPSSRRGWTWRTWAVGAAYAATVVLFVIANKQTTVRRHDLPAERGAALRAARRHLPAARARPPRRPRRDGAPARRPDPLRRGHGRPGRTRPPTPPSATPSPSPRASPGPRRCSACAGWRAAGGRTHAGAAVIAGNLLAFVCCVPFALPPSGDGQDWRCSSTWAWSRSARLPAAHRRHADRRPRSRSRCCCSSSRRLQPGLVLAVPRERLRSPSTIAGGVLILGATAFKVCGRRPPRDPRRRWRRPRGPPLRDPGGRAANVLPMRAPRRPGPGLRGPRPHRGGAGGAQSSPLPPFRAVVRALTPQERADMTPSVWRRGCPVGLSELRHVSLPFVGFGGRARRGALVVNASATGDVVAAFRALYKARFPIRRMKPIQAYGGRRLRSIEADNTSSFNCRPATGSSTGRTTRTATRSTSTRSRTRTSRAGARPTAAASPTSTGRRTARG